MSKKITVVLLLIAGITLSGCLQQEPTVYPATGAKYVYVTPDEGIIQQSVVISGVDQSIDISAKQVVVSGTGNTVKILNSNVETIVISGVDNMVYYPSNSNPTLSYGGVRIKLIKY